MPPHRLRRHPRRVLLAVAALAVTALAASLAPGASAAPGAAASGADQTLTLPSHPGHSTVSFTGTAPFNNQQDGLVYGQTGIDDPTKPCAPATKIGNDQHRITVRVPKHISQAYDTLIRFQINWTPVASEPLEDLALYVYAPDGTLAGVSDGSQASEGVNLTEALPGTYAVVVCAFQNLPQGTKYTGTVAAYTIAPSPFPAARGVKRATFAQFTAPSASATQAGEPSIGNDWKTGHTLFTANTQEYDVAFNDAARTATWTAVNTRGSSPNGSNLISLDPIGYTDPVTGRSFISQLVIACSGAAYSDNDFKTSTVSEGCGSGINGGDHQTFGGGPFPETVSKLTAYPHAVYYCAQSAAFAAGGAWCARSDDGGLSFGPALEVFNAKCNGLHGHIRVGPDGTAYLPDANCAGKQGVAISRDGGATWSVSRIPDSVAGSSDPSISIGADNTVYYGYSDGTGKPKIAVSRSHGASWSRSVDAGLPYGIHNSEFAEVIAGDGDRAAFAFLGTPSRGSTQAASFGKDKSGSTFVGAEWHLYVSMTYDRGAHWTTVDATPGDPVQRGCIWNNGGSNPCRNLLDFNDITIAKDGRVMVAIADGCVGPEVEKGNNCVASRAVGADKLTQHGAIVRQESGRGLFHKYDTSVH